MKKLLIVSLLVIAFVGLKAFTIPGID